MNRRELSAGEAAILALIQAHYGTWNAETDVTFSEAGDAVIFVKDAEGSMVLMVNLTNLAAWRADGTISTEKELLVDWLEVEDG